MFNATKKKLEESMNSVAIEFSNNNFIHVKQDKPAITIMFDAIIAHRLLINSKQLGLTSSSTLEELGITLKKELGEYYGNFLLQNYSQLPLKNICEVLNNAIKENGGKTEDFISDAFSQYSMNTYIKDNQLHYECTIKNIKTNKAIPFPGSVSCLYIYDNEAKTFVLVHIECSNKVLHDMIVKNEFDVRISRETAAIEEAEQKNGTMLEQPEYSDSVLHEMIFNDNFKTEKEKALKEAKIFLNGLVEAKKLLEPHVKFIKNNSSHPLAIFNKTISAAIDILTKQYEEKADLHDELAKQKKLCKAAFKQVVIHTVFPFLRPLLNNLAALLRYPIPYPNIEMDKNVSIGKLIEINKKVNSTPKPGR